LFIFQEQSLSIFPFVERNIYNRRLHLTTNQQPGRCNLICRTILCHRQHGWINWTNQHIVYTSVWTTSGKWATRLSFDCQTHGLDGQLL